MLETPPHQQRTICIYNMWVSRYIDWKAFCRFAKPDVRSVIVVSTVILVKFGIHVFHSSATYAIADCQHVPNKDGAPPHL